MMKKNLLGDRAALADEVPRKSSPTWPLRVATAVVIALGSYSATDALALGLGRITVLSALGEPLRAEIDIPQITVEEASNLKAGIANPAAFRTAGVDYSTALTGTQIALQKRSDGTFFLRLTNDRTVNDPFIDLILEARWSSGQIVRDYTLLFDPPSTKQATTVAPVAAQVTPVSPITTTASPIAPRVPATPSMAPPAKAPSAPAPTPTPVAAPTPLPTPVKVVPVATLNPAPVAVPSPAVSEKKQVKVQPGDTATKIAAAHKLSDISLDQMLVALLRANPNAFIDGNVNRIKAGSLLELPSSDQVSSLTSNDARKTLSVQSANFNEYRKKLAEASSPTQVASADRQASGSLQTRVEDKKAAAASPDKLTLSKGSVQGKPAEAQIAESRQKKESGERVAELSKNVKDLASLQTQSAGSGVAKAPVATSGLSVPNIPIGVPLGVQSSQGVVQAGAVAPAQVTSKVVPPPPSSAATPAVPAPASAVATSAVASAPEVMAAPAAVAASAPASTASAETPALAASTAASVPAAPAPAASKPVAAKPPIEEPSMLDSALSLLTDDPLIPASFAGLIALLGGGFAFYRFRSRKAKKSSLLDSAFIESRMQPDSFFGSSGGQHIDTNDTNDEVGGSSLAYSPSQLDAAGDVDPVAEADVYLAYGRDLQAEEILKEALRVNPSRIAIHGKLLEIYAKRRDIRAFEVAAAEARKLSGGEGAEWERICEFGRELDSTNALYQLGSPPLGGTVAAVPTSQDPISAAFGNSTLPPPMHTDFDDASSIDLDLGYLDEDAVAPPPVVPSTTPTQMVAAKPLSPAAPAVATPPLSQPVTTASIDFSMPDLAFTTSEPPAKPAPVTAPVATPLQAAPDSGMIEFDLGSLSFEMDTPAASSPSTPAPDATSLPTLDQDDPMATKLELAQEFHAIGDTEGARALVEEVVAGSTGALKAKAQRFLAELG